jgi:hypothetical protein
LQLGINIIATTEYHEYASTAAGIADMTRDRYEERRTLARVAPLVSAVVCLVATTSIDAQTIDVGRQKQLFIDDYIVAKTKGVFRTLNHPVKYEGNPLISPPEPRPGEPELVILGGSVIYDQQERLFKMWYEATDHQRTHSAVGYATSTDGIDWDLPHHGRIEFPQWRDPRFATASTDNNFVFDRPTELVLCVFKDPVAKTPDRRYKMIYREASGGKSGLFAAFSPDGIHWSGETGPILPSADSFHSVIWNATWQKYVIHSRHNETSGKKTRQVLQSESDDFVNWTRHGVIMKPDEEDPPENREFYNMEWMPYEGVFIGFISVYHIQREWERRKPQFEWEDKIDVQLAFSRDNRNWIRAGDRKVFIPNSHMPGDYDFGMIWNVLQHPIVVGDEIFIYYNGTTGLHWASSRGEVEGGVIALAKLRLDGFVSLDVGSSLGTVTTKPMKTSEDQLIVNADARFGSIRVEVLDTDGHPLDGFAKEDAIPITGDSVRHQATWKGDRLLKDITDQPLVLRFYMDRCKLYAFGFVAEPAEG